MAEDRHGDTFGAYDYLSGDRLCSSSMWLSFRRCQLNWSSGFLLRITANSARLCT